MLTYLKKKQYIFTCLDPNKPNKKGKKRRINWV